MEVIELPGYTRDEKVAIGAHYIVPRQLERHGLTPNELVVPPTTLHHLASCHTMEAGVRLAFRNFP